MIPTNRLFIATTLFAVALLLAACGKPAKKESSKTSPKDSSNSNVPVFSLAWSEYPSWSTFGVAHEIGLIDGRAGKMGPLEKKWGVDIELKEADYDTCIVMYGAGKCDAACLTNMDSLNPCLTLQTVCIIPSSTSFGADALLVPQDVKDIKQLRGKNIYGLANSVSQYCFARNLELLGENEKDYKFTNMDPGAAALAMQLKKTGYESIIVWNPFVLDTLNKRKDVHRLFDSTKIPGEIIDMVVMSQASLDRPGGQAFACAVIDTFYEISRRIVDPKTHNETLIALGEKFAHLDLPTMEEVVKQTKFYSTPTAGLERITGKEIDGLMKRVVDFCVSHKIVPNNPSIGYGNKAAAPTANFRLDPTYIQEYVVKTKGS